jgi:hypothetical protein
MVLQAPAVAGQINEATLVGRFATDAFFLQVLKLLSVPISKDREQFPGIVELFSFLSVGVGYFASNPKAGFQRIEVGIHIVV